MCQRCLYVFLAGAATMYVIHKLFFVCAGASPEYLGALIGAAFTGFCLYRARSYSCGCTVQ